MNKPLIVLQARTGSSRLPDKMILPFYQGKSVLTILIERLKVALKKDRNQIVVATTESKRDNAIETICNDCNIRCFRGSEDDVLNRFICTAKKFHGDKLIRICADNVFLDMDSLLRLYNFLNDNEEYSYISFKKSDNTPSILTHFGFWAEGTRLPVLEKVAQATSDRLYHEHVTNYIYTHKNEYNCHFFQIDKDIESRPNLRLTLDTKDDFEIQKIIYTHLNENGENISPKNIINYLDSRPELYEIMRKNIISNSK